MPPTNCDRFKCFDDAYGKLIQTMLNKPPNAAEVRAAYANWLNTRAACQEIVRDAGQRDDWKQLAAIDTVVMIAFDSLDDDWATLVSRFLCYKWVSDNAFSVLCPNRKGALQRVVDALILEPNFFGIGVKLKTLFGLDDQSSSL